ncbi:macro domain-containing protein [Vibrio sp. CAU 1672]|uniref:macro domain-containing protein n=1 Tax=Vibrio sp. CAU 1672 TaxID=3032594 RepID=UPI0023DC42DD|nr:macro domain-containing protein [Vibrio sp. CAU 1672]MDF2155850.1 macro domain-containing protein [Vibrio sp. CAU 1672]
MGKILILKGDITTANVDAIVNAANPSLLGGGGVDGAIHRAAGLDLLRACHQIEAVDGVRCPYGEARITSAGNLHARFVIHTVGPIYHQVSNPRRILASAYQQSLDLALSNACRSVALPAISCGIYGYPPEEAAEVAFGVCLQPQYQPLELHFYLFSDEMAYIWRNAYQGL